MKKDYPHIKNVPDHEEPSRDGTSRKKTPGSDHDHSTEKRRDEERNNIKKEDHDKHKGK